MANLNVAILGMNRTSASMGLALKRYTKKGGKHKFNITGYDSVPETLKVAKKMGAVDKTESHADSAVKDADIVLMAVSYDETEYAYREIRGNSVFYPDPSGIRGDPALFSYQIISRIIIN